jgi:hypothetical protein
MKEQFPNLVVAFSSNEQALKALSTIWLNKGCEIYLSCLENNSVFSVNLTEKFHADENTPISHLKFIVKPDMFWNDDIYN